MTTDTRVDIHPRLTAVQQLRAAQFVAQHLRIGDPILLPRYQQRTIQRWHTDSYPRDHKPFWLRKIDTESERPDSIAVDYCIVVPRIGQYNFGSLIIDQNIQIALPTVERPEIEVVHTQPYSFAALALAIETVEKSVVKSD